MSELTEHMPSVSVVIPAYGHCPHLPEVVAAIYDGTVTPLEVIVSHSGADDPSEVLTARFDGVSVLHEDGRLFAGAARNRGAAIAEGEILAFCDADTRPEKDWLAQIIEGIQSNPNQFVVGAVAMARRGGYWGMSNWLLEFSEQAPWRSLGFQHGGASCNMAVHRRDFVAIGGFREDLRGGEDTTLFADLRKADLGQVFLPKAIVGHFNLPGFAAFAGHQAGLGASFAEVRKASDMPGSFMVRHPPLALLFWVPKAFVVLRRTMGSGLRPGLLALFLTPGILLGSVIWSVACHGRSFALWRMER
jgi:hypothetical protein